VLDHVKVRVTTLGKHGVEITGRDIDRIHVPVARDVIAGDPTGVGDGFRAGFFSAISWGLGLERAAQVGSLVAALVLETVGPQEYEIKGDFFAKRLADSYGDEAAAEVHPYLPA
jgi:adenosine kinase